MTNQNNISENQTIKTIQTKHFNILKIQKPDNLFARLFSGILFCNSSYGLNFNFYLILLIKDESLHHKLLLLPP
jgi:hypothetical protein